MSIHSAHRKRLASGALTITAVGLTALTVMACKWPPGTPGTTPGPQPEDPRDLKTLDARRAQDIKSLGFELIASPRLCFLRPRVDAASIDVDRSLFVHDRATLDAGDFSLRRTLGKIVSDATGAGAVGVTAQTLFRDLWDTQNPRATGATAVGAHCDDNGTTLNGFPNACRPSDGAQATSANLDGQINAYRAIGLVNRIDLAAEGWKNCGEHRIVYGRQGAGIQRSFIIFEAVLPNPRPGCQSGCRAVADHWHSLAAIDDAAERAAKLEELFYEGLPGFRPVVHVDHYSAKGTASRYGSSGSGQIRTNQFLEQPWMLKEFKLALDCSQQPCQLATVPIPVKVNPDGNLWTESAAGLANQFQQNVVLPQVASLGQSGLNAFSYQVPAAFNAARSEAQTGGLADNYGEAYTAAPGQPNGFRSDLVAQVATTAPALTDRQIVNRAAALSCAGCHQPSVFGLRQANAIGPGQTWPDSASFVHVSTTAVAGVHQLSPALRDEFLPARAENLAALLSANTCPCKPKLGKIEIPRLEREVFIRPPRSLEDLRLGEDRMKALLDTDLSNQGKERLPDFTLDRKAQSLDLPVVRKASAATRAQVLRVEVQKLVAEEPPRKTVGGSFRVH